MMMHTLCSYKTVFLNDDTIFTYNNTTNKKAHTNHEDSDISAIEKTYLLHLNNARVSSLAI